MEKRDESLWGLLEWRKGRINTPSYNYIWKETNMIKETKAKHYDKQYKYMKALIMFFWKEDNMARLTDMVEE